MKKTLTAAAVAAVISPVGSLTLVEGVSADTNVSIGGYVRGGYYYLTPDEGESTGRFEYRGRFQADMQDDNGLRATLRLQGTDGGGQTGGTGQANVIVDRALIRFAGFRLGFSDTFETTFHGYGNFVERRDGDYGFDQGFFFDYTNSFSFFDYGIGIQDTDFEGGATNAEVDPYVGIGFNFVGVALKGTALLDADAGESQLKFSANYSLGGLQLKAWFRDQTGENKYSAGATSGDADTVGIDADNASFGGSVRFQFLDQIGVGLGYSGNDLDGSDEFIISATYDIVPGLSFRPELAFVNDFDDVDIGFRLYRTF